MKEHRTGVLAFVLWAGLLILITLAVHFIYAVWPWPGAAGSAPLREAVLTERARVEELAAPSSLTVIGTVIEWTYRIGFEWTGMDYLRRVATAVEPPEGSPSDLGRRLASGMWNVLEPLYWSLQLLGLRLGILLASAPLFLVAAIGGAADGAAAWYQRRTRVGRESGFIYHRAKFALWTALFALWAVYLLPPVAIDPLITIPPFVVLFGLTVRIAVAWFKKHI